MWCGFRTGEQTCLMFIKWPMEYAVPDQKIIGIVWLKRSSLGMEFQKVYYQTKALIRDLCDMLGVRDLAYH